MKACIKNLFDSKSHVLYVLSTLLGIKHIRILLCDRSLTFHTFPKCRFAPSSKIVLEAELLLAVGNFVCFAKYVYD